MKRIFSRRCFILKAEFKVSVEIDEQLPEGIQYIDENALKNKGEKLSCVTAIITSLARKKTQRRTEN